MLSLYFHCDRIHKADCYEIYVWAKNPVSKLQSNIVTICVEEQISGLNINVPEYVDLNKNIDLFIDLDR